MLQLKQSEELVMKTLSLILILLPATSFANAFLSFCNMDNAPKDIITTVAILKIMHLEGSVSVTDMASKEITGEVGEVVVSSLNTKFRHYKFPTKQYQNISISDFEKKLLVSFRDKSNCEQANEIIANQDNLILTTDVLFPRERMQNYPVSNLEPIRDFKKLKTLIINLNAVSDLRPISGLENLYHLSLYKNQVSDLRPISSLRNLVRLDVAANRISNISPLVSLKKLKELDLFLNNISDISPLAQLPQLYHLSLSSNKISDIRPLSGMKQLNYLNLRRNSVSDISPLGYLKSLRFLVLSDNRIKDVSPLGDLANLQSLKLRNNQISDLAPVAKFRSIKHYDDRGNPGAR